MSARRPRVPLNPCRDRLAAHSRLCMKPPRAACGRPGRCCQFVRPPRPSDSPTAAFGTRPDLPLAVTVEFSAGRWRWP